MQTTTRLQTFVQSFTRLIEQAGGDEQRIFTEGSMLLAALVSQDDWLPDAFAQPNPDTYQQYLLHCDPIGRFSIVSFVWGPGQSTPVHDHTVWGMVGVLRGAEICEEFAQDLVSPRVGDIHKVSNALDDRASISIHIYGANIGAVQRHTDDPATGQRRALVSGYASG